MGGTRCTLTRTRPRRPRRLVDDEAERARVAAGWSFGVDDTYTLFEFSIERALLGARPSADDWPPRYSSWPDRPPRTTT